MDRCPKCGAEYDSDDYFKCGSRKTWGPFVMGLNQSEKCRVRELTAEVQRLREAGREVVCVISRCSCEKCADLARRRWQEVDPR